MHSIELIIRAFELTLVQASMLKYGDLLPGLSQTGTATREIFTSFREVQNYARRTGLLY